ncbi:MAG: flagellar brake protein [Defluviitaleaceae bacterium]|nr:flagellar brake protein [Defluviitaleaceae bacterium]
MVKAGDRLELTLAKKTPINWNSAYTSKVESADEPDTLLVHAPISLGKIVKLPVNADCTIRVFTEKGIIEYTANITGSFIDESSELVELTISSVGDKVQRRDFFRFNCAVLIDYIILNESGMPTDSIIRDGVIRDMSGGGMRLLSKYNIEINSIIRLMLPLEKDELMILGQVLRMDINQKAIHPFQYRIRFTAMTSAEQDKLIQYIYQEQRKIIQRQ